MNSKGILVKPIKLLVEMCGSIIKFIFKIVLFPFAVPIAVITYWLDACPYDSIKELVIGYFEDW